MEFWRSEAYMKFFEYLDSQGGFYYEVSTNTLSFLFSLRLVFQRWGDAPVHSIAAALFRPKDQIHFFHDIGYEHHPYNHCPLEEKTWRNGRCSCGRRQSFGMTFYLVFDSGCLADVDIFSWDRL
jgi:alpha 1,2-mannosyltransferase